MLTENVKQFMCSNVRTSTCECSSFIFFFSPNFFPFDATQSFLNKLKESEKKTTAVKEKQNSRLKWMKVYQYL